MHQLLHTACTLLCQAHVEWREPATRAITSLRAHCTADPCTCRKQRAHDSHHTAQESHNTAVSHLPLAGVGAGTAPFCRPAAALGGREGEVETGGWPRTS